MSQSGTSAPTCAHCGAPDNGEFVICRFCKQAVNAEAARSAIPCPNANCKTLSRWGRQKCVACQHWIVVSCVFCGSLSPHNVSNCLNCREAFAGAQQRKMQMEQQRQHHQNVQNANVWGNVAAAFVGAAAGSAISHSFDSSYDYDPPSADTFDVSDVSDGFDFGGFDD